MSDPIRHVTILRSPVFLVNSRCSLLYATEVFTESEVSAPLFPKLRGQFAEFLQCGYLIRLCACHLSTRVGLGYGLYASHLFSDVFYPISGSKRALKSK